jgi:hypothetical protein
MATASKRLVDMKILLLMDQCIKRGTSDYDHRIPAMVQTPAWYQIGLRHSVHVPDLLHAGLDSVVVFY